MGKHGGHGLLDKAHEVPVHMLLGLGLQPGLGCLQHGCHPLDAGQQLQQRLTLAHCVQPPAHTQVALCDEGRSCAMSGVLCAAEARREAVLDHIPAD